MMRRTLILLLLVATPLFAGDAPERWRMSVLRVQSGVAVDGAYALTPAWGLELGASEQQFTAPYTQFFTGPPPLGLLPATFFKSYKVHPIDLTATRRWTSDDRRLTPYGVLGVRYVDAPDDPPPVFPATPGPGGALPATPGFHFHDRASAQAGAGALFRLTPRTAIRAEVMRLLRSEDAQFDPLTRYAAGLSWHF